MEQQGVEGLNVETTSNALAQNRVWGEISDSCFTNLTTNIWTIMVRLKIIAMPR